MSCPAELPKRAPSPHPIHSPPQNPSTDERAVAQETPARIRLALPDGGPGAQVPALWSRSRQRAVGSLTAIWWEAPANPPILLTPHPPPPPSPLRSYPTPTPGAGPGRSRDKAPAECIRAGSSGTQKRGRGSPSGETPSEIGDGRSGSCFLCYASHSALRTFGGPNLAPHAALSCLRSSGHSGSPRFATSATFVPCSCSLGHTPWMHRSPTLCQAQAGVARTEVGHDGSWPRVEMDGYTIGNNDSGSYSGKGR